MPERPPTEKGEAQGRTTEGHATDGNDTHKPPADATERTHDIDRKASEAAKLRAGYSAARKTEAKGNAKRTATSTPPAQPTETDAPSGTQETANATDAESDAPTTEAGTERLPEKPKLGNDENKIDTDMMK